MIRYRISLAKLREAIEQADANWFRDATKVLAGLPATPASSDFVPLWGKIKTIYIDLQCSKCCFCEKPLEGKIEQDVEHFRPKTEVKSWNIPSHLLAVGIAVQQPANGSSEPGYAQLAYEPFNYAMSCKVCNSVLKKNLFPIEGQRDYSGADPTRMGGEKPLFIYPIGETDVDPEKLIEFDGLSPLPKRSSGFGRRRALVTIDVFRLDDSVGRRSLFKQRAYLVRMLFLELVGEGSATSAKKRNEHRAAIDALTSPEAPFTNCLRSFERLYHSDPTRAASIAAECLKFIQTKSIRRGRS